MNTEQPGPTTALPGELKTYLGTTKISFFTAKTSLAIIDTPLVS